MNTFPLADKQDSSKFSMSTEDTTLRSKMEGGYVYTRSKHTRAPRKTFKTGFTALTQENKEILEQFCLDVRGGVDIFNWTNPTDLKTYKVRFSKPLDYKYAGYGTTFLWDVSSIELEEV